jgi:hypothetical protein
MLIPTSLVAVLAASSAVSAGASLPATTALPEMVVAVSAAPEVSASVVTRLLEETDAIWRAAGLRFVWQRTPRVAASLAVNPPGPYQSSTLRVIIGESRGVARVHRTPLGWIVFDDEREPQQEIYLSHANAVTLMERARNVVGIVQQMPIAQREILLARAMGRALAHELGHYLLASKVHTPRGLLQASRTASELFSTDRRSFVIDGAQRQLIAARMRSDPLVARR